MSKINDQIKQLQLKLKKIEFLTHILDSAKSYDHKDFAEVKDDIVSMLESFVESAINEIETGQKTMSSSALEEDEVVLLKQVAQKLKTKPPTPINEQARVDRSNQNDPYGDSQPKAPVPPKKPVTDNNDKLSFALGNRHLANKRVTVANDKNMTIAGTVVGLDAPNVIVKTDTGPTIHVPIENISLAR